MIGRLLAALVLLLIPMAAAAAPDRPVVLLFTHSSGHRHASIEPAAAALARLAADAGLAVETSDSPAIFDRPIERFAAIVLVSTTSDGDRPQSEWFVGDRRTRLQQFLAAGHGIMAIHGAADSHRHWPWYAQMIGGRFAHHPPGAPEGQVIRGTAIHPSTRTLPSHFLLRDEWYLFDDLDPRLDPLLMLDPASAGLRYANPRPIAWAHGFGGGRVFYSALGHDAAGWRDPNLLAHMAGGLAWAADVAKAPAMVVLSEADTRRDEPPPHGRIGMSTAYRLSDAVPGRTMDYRRRDLHVGAAIGVHPIDHDEVYHVLSGEGEVVSDGQVRRLTAGMAAYLFSGAKVGIRQIGKQPLSLIVAYPLATPVPPE